jgi:hypothetical protein
VSVSGSTCGSVEIVLALPPSRLTAGWDASASQSAETSRIEPDISGLSCPPDYGSLTSEDAVRYHPRLAERIRAERPSWVAVVHLELAYTPARDRIPEDCVADREGWLLPDRSDQGAAQSVVAAQ